MNWVSLAQLARDIPLLARKLPLDTVAVIGVPRSGMLVATMLAQHMHLPLGEAGEFIETGHLAYGGGRLSEQSTGRGTLVLVDDSLRSGTSMQPYAEAAEWHLDGTTLTTAAMYVTPRGRRKVDEFGRIVGCPRLFEWNWLHHRAIGRAALDLDGVLCEDPPERETDDEEQFGALLAAAEPKFLPRRPLRGIVTSRLEKYRELTEAWLERHRIAYKALIMHPAKSPRERRRGPHGRNMGHWKAEQARELGAKWFVESDRRQAGQIAAAGMTVLCTDKMEVYCG